MDHVKKLLKDAKAACINIRYTSCSVKRDWLTRKLENDLDACVVLLEQIQYRHENRQNREFSIEELSKYDGNQGREAYIAVDGVVYDVSNEPTWAGASHFSLMAGKELTSQFNRCHTNRAILSKLPIVGRLK